jgi:N-acetylmuramoyl-L-alanine amidase
MRRKRSHVILTVIFSLLAVLLAVGALLASGIFTKRPIIDVEEVTAPQMPVIAPNDRTVWDSDMSLPGKNYGSDLMDGVLLDLSRDIPLDGSLADVMTRLYQAFLYYRNCGPDTLFLRPDTSGRFEGRKNNDGTPFDLTGAAVSYSHSFGYYTVLTVDESFFPAEEKPAFGSLFALLDKYSFDAILYIPASMICGEAFFDTAKQIRSALDGAGKETPFGCMVFSGPSVIGVPSVSLNGFLKNRTADFVCVNPGSLTTSSTLSFGGEMAAWNALAAGYPETVFYCAHRISAVEAAPSPGEEMERQLEIMDEQEHFRGSLYCSGGDLQRCVSAAHRISKHYFREDPYDFKVDSLTVSEDNASVVFGGTAIPGKKLIIDRDVVAPAGGPFAVTCALGAGLNRFALRNGGFTNRFTIEKIGEGKREAQPSPYGDNGLGRALMCRVDADLTPSMAASGVYDTFNPDFTDLPAGTLDYVKAITYDEGIRYELTSGLSVSAWNATLLCGAYALPENDAACVGADDSDPRCTKLTFISNWCVPVTLTLSPQPYRKGPLDFSYNVDSFSAAYLDVIFHHSKRISLQQSLRFGADSPVERAEVLSGGAGSAVLRLHLKPSARFCGAFVSRDVNGNFIVSVKKKAASLSAAKVMLDPGHGGLYMTGTALNDQSLSEKEVTLNLAMKVRDLLTAQGIDVRLTRESEVSLTLEERKALCAEYDPDVFVSIHCDGVEDMGESGTHSFYYKPFSQPLAASVHNRLVDVYTSVIYTSIDRNYDQIDKSIKYYPFHVTREDNCPSILVESGFMSNDYEGRILADENCRKWIADAIAGGIVDYLTGE